VNKAAYEISFKDHFDKQIINDHLEEARAKAVVIVQEFIDK
jgi:guanylate kinase